MERRLGYGTGEGNIISSGLTVLWVTDRQPQRLLNL